MSKFNVRVEGLDKVMNSFIKRASTAADNADKVTETYTRKMANESSEQAPYKTGALRSDVAASPRRIRKGTWEYGSRLPYARKQEYEHASRRGFIRKVVWRNRTPYREAIKRELSKK